MLLFPDWPLKKARTLDLLTKDYFFPTTCATDVKNVGIRFQLFGTFADIGLKRHASQRIDTSRKTPHFDRMALEKSTNSAIKEREHAIKNKEEVVNESGVITFFKEY